MARRRVLAVSVAACTMVLSALAVSASAHEERKAIFPTGAGHWIQNPRTYSASRPHIVVCQPDSAQRIAKLKSASKRAFNQQLLPQCKYHSIQLAVDAVKHQGTDIWMLPGLYTESQYDGLPKGACASLQPVVQPDFVGTLTDPTGQPPHEDGSPVAISYKDQLRCPHNLNLIAILGDHTPLDDPSKETPQTIACDSALCGIQLAGTGESSYDVVIDNRFSKLNGIRADRVDGVIFSNFTVQRAEFNSLYIMESDGYLLDHVIARANEEYGFLTFASDHGIYQYNEAYFNGDSGLYPGAASDINAHNLNFPVTRYAVEVRHNHSHDNNLGYSGTAGNSVWVHDNVFDHNSTGIVTDSLFPNHPGLPQDHARFGPNNVLASNNQNFFTRYEFPPSGDPICAKPIEQRGYLEHGVVCPSVISPVGTGLTIAGGNFDQIDHNKIYDNWRYGTLQLWVPAVLRDEMNPLLTYDTSNNNHSLSNRLAENPGGPWRQPNGIDFFWDREGSGNCWQNNTALGGSPTTNIPAPLPATCSNTGQGVKVGGHLVSSNPGTSAFTDPGFISCTQYDGVNTSPAVVSSCEWFKTPSQPAGRQGPAYNSANFIAPFVDSLHVAPLTGTNGSGRTAGGGSSPSAGGPGLATTGGGIGLAVAGVLTFGVALWLWRRSRRSRPA